MKITDEDQPAGLLEGRTLQDSKYRFGNSAEQSLKEGGVLVMMAIAGYLVLALTSYHAGDSGHFSAASDAEIVNLAGISGAWIAQLLLQMFGALAYAIPAAVAWLPIYIWRALARGRTELSWINLAWHGIGMLLMFFSACGLVALYWWDYTGTWPSGLGGIFGMQISDTMKAALSSAGSTLVLLAAFMVGTSLGTGISWLHLLERAGFFALAAARKSGQAATALRFWLQARIQAVAAMSWRQLKPAATAPAPQAGQLAGEQAPSSSSDVADTAQGASSAAVESTARKKRKKSAEHRSTNQKTRQSNQAQQTETKQTATEQQEQPGQNTLAMPGLDLLTGVSESEMSEADRTALHTVSRLVEAKLLDFGVEVKVTSAHPGPVITRLEAQPAAGVKASKITSLAKDLARSLAVVSVRVVEVIPGKTVIGIEIPNAVRETVRLSALLSSDAYLTSTSSLTVALGQDIAGEPVCADLAALPHLLVAGTTGSGKSVGVNAMLLSILFKASPEQVRLILVDPKMLELSAYEGIPHLLTPVITDMKQAAGALRWCIYEMERRYRLMAAVGVRHLAGFNHKAASAAKSKTPAQDLLWEGGPEDAAASNIEALPAIVVVIDEFADMMMMVGKKVEALIVRLAQKARAAGIHLVLATQRPSVDVITGLIKANIPGRISFQVSSRVDSRTILDQGGAEQLLGHGDMLYMPPGTSVPMRIHGAFVEDAEVHRVTADWRQKGRSNYLPAVLKGGVDNKEQLAGAEDAEADDALYDQAVAHVVESKRASISSVQRKLRIGYNRAARMIEAMEQAGIVSAMDNVGNREVLVTSGTDS